MRQTYLGANDDPEVELQRGAGLVEVVVSVRAVDGPVCQFVTHDSRRSRETLR